MSKPIQLQIIEEARARLADDKRWCRGEMAFDKFGVPVRAIDSRASKWCAYGALLAAAHRVAKDSSRAFDLTGIVVRYFGGSDALMRINDTKGHAAVLALFDEIIARFR